MKVGQKVVIFNQDGRVLAMRRSETDPSRPLTWDVPGGELEEGEGMHEGLLREVQEESNITIEDIALVDVWSFRNKHGEFWVGIGYKARAKTSEVLLSFEHDFFEWITIEEFLTRESSQSIQRLLSLIQKK